jgi:hypothetical protein
MQVQDNVLYEPAIYQEPIPENFDEHMVETQSISTVNNASIVTNYTRDIDPALLTSQKMYLHFSTNTVLTFPLFSRCCVCGVSMVPNPSRTCINCLKSQIDISEGISKTVNLMHCRECNRYQRPPWVACELESSELLSLCLK